MLFKILTLPFDDKTEGFDDEIIASFCENKRVHRLESHFFQKEGQVYWSVAIHYEVVTLKKADKVRELDDTQQLLFQRLREWRKETGNQQGVPVYIIATNAQLVNMIKIPTKTLESFKLVKGFGNKRIEKHGRRIIEIIKGFYEAQTSKKDTTIIENKPLPPTPF